MEFSQPPPALPNFNAPPPMQQMMHHKNQNYHHHHHHHHNNNMAGKSGSSFYKPFTVGYRGPGGIPMTQDDFDGKRLRKSVMRKTVDYNASIIKTLEV